MVRSMLKTLIRPEAYPDPVSSVSMVQTHVSWIFLTDRHAYKIKKPVDFGFLNFSTLDRRRFYCNEELRLNRRLCPDIYEAVVEVRRNETNGGACFFGNGQIIDYAVRMKRLPADRMLDRLVRENRASKDDLRRVAGVIARFHASAPTSPQISDHGDIERITFNCQENFNQIGPFCGQVISDATLAAIRAWVEHFIAEKRELFAQRVRDGFIRECDGDLHLENICLETDQIHIFDCIEFNDRFRCCDTAADVAFLLMDLDYHGRSDLTEAVIDEYLSATGDGAFIELDLFYRIYRAFVRGKVESFLTLDSGIDEASQQQALQRAGRYFRLARGYVARMSLPPLLLITCGLMGSGKSTIARQLAFELGLTVLRSDEIRKQRAGLAANSAARHAYGEGLYTAEHDAGTYDELFRKAGHLMGSGKTALIDASFIRRADRQRAAALASAYGVRLVILAPECPRQKLLERLARREDLGNDISDGRPELLDRQISMSEPLSDDQGTIIRIPSDLTVEQAADLVYREMDRL